MKAIGFLVPTPKLVETSFSVFELPSPRPGADDLLVEVKAISVNPVDYKQRQTRPSDAGVPVILGWDAAGIVRGVGGNVHAFKEGDEVYYAGELRRAGSNAEFQLVDSRLASRKPSTLSFSAAAAMPLTALTAYEALFEQLQVPTAAEVRILIVGGAGGVGSMAIQMLRNLTEAEIFATAGRADSSAWATAMGAHQIVDRNKSLLELRESNQLPEFDFIFSTTNSERYHSEFPSLLKPYGKLCLIDDPKQFDIMPFKLKSQTVQWELMFTKGLFKTNRESQGRILADVSSLTDAGKLKSTINHCLSTFSPENLMLAHRMQESGASIGKTVIEF